MSFRKKRNPKRRFVTETLEPRHLLAGDLIGHWNADSVPEATDGSILAIWTDQVSQNQATNIGTPMFVADGIGGRAAIRFDPSDGEIDGFEVLGSRNPLTGANDFSVSAVFQTSSNQLLGENGPWFENTGIVDSNALGFGRDWGISINHAGQVASGMGDGFGNPHQTVYSSVSSLNDGSFHIAILTRAGGTLQLNIDGQNVGSIENASQAARDGIKLAMGMLESRRNGFDGLIADVRFFDGQLSEGEVTDLYNQLEGYYNNSPPDAVDDTYTLPEDAIIFAVSAANGVLQNDVDAEGDPFTATLVEETSHGTISFRADGGFIYDSDMNFNGIDTFTYRAENFRSSNVATVTLNVTNVYDPPILGNDVYQIRPGETLAVSKQNGLLSNDLNPDKVSFKVVLKEAINAGNLSLNEDGSFAFDPQGFAGIARFTYQIDDGTRISNPAEVQIAVTTPPVAIADTYQVDEDTSLLISPSEGVLANDQDAEDNTLTATLIESTQNGTLAFQPSGAFVYQPNPEFHGTDTFTYLANDGFDDANPATVTIIVESVNDLPLAGADAYFTLPSQTVSRNSENGLLANDFDVDDTNLSARLTKNVTNGTLEFSADGSFHYTPNDGFEGEDFFTYVVFDGTAESAATEVYIGVDAAPFVINEIMADNIDTIRTRTRTTVEARFRGERLYFDWIEIKNSLTRDFDIGGLHLTDSSDNLKLWRIPDGIIIPADGFVLFYASGLDIPPELDETQTWHTNFRLGSDGEYLAITSQEGSVIDELAPQYPQQLVAQAFGRTETGIGYLASPTPGEANVSEAFEGITAAPTIDTVGGFFDQPVQFSVTSLDETATLRYTLDGSSPNSENGMDYQGPVTINKTSVFRAAAIRDGYLPSRIDSRSFIFLEDVLRQSPDGQPMEGWPARWGANATDYGMDPEIVDDDVWGPQMIDALTQIPSMSIVTDLDHLFDSRTGIYARPGSDGFAWERPASLELLNPDGSEGFQHNIGIRIRGGFSRSTNNPKHAFRVFFNSEYGDGDLEFPLFGDEGADTFAKVDLRTSQNYSWAFQGNNQNNFLRDIYSRDLQGQMGHQYTRGRYYHLYINGMYFGLFQTDERPEANFGASYYGGDREDYDVVHNDPRANGATDGNLEAYQRLFERVVEQDGGLSDANMEDYYRVQGLNPDGTRNPEYERMLDVENVIDYMIITYYTSDADGPGSKFTRPGLNNYFAMYNREDPDGWKFFEHDSEHSLDTGNAAGANYNMVTPLVNNGRRFPNFNPHYMHERLAETNSDYLQRFVDRVHEVFQDDGILGDDNVQKMLRDRAAQIDMAIIAESARWGDAKRGRPFTKRDWERSVNTTVNWVTRRGRGEGRRSEVIGQLMSVDWYPDPDTIFVPEFSQDGGRVDVGFELTVNAQSGDIYVSTDGGDPRASGGAISDNAVKVDSGGTVIITTSAPVKARTLTDGVWSPLKSAEFFVEPFATINSLHVSEVHYNPELPSDQEIEAGYDDKDEFEFIEFVNVSDQTIDLTGIQLQRVSTDDGQQGVEFDFSDKSIRLLEPGGRVLVVENHPAFQTRHGDQLPVLGQWAGGLSNNSETITLTDVNGDSFQFTYDDSWHPTTDGDGFSLQINHESDANLENWNLAGSWRASFQIGGTPGTASAIPGDSNLDGVFDSNDLIVVFQIGEYEDNIPDNSTFAEGDWNGDGDFDTSDLVFAFIVGLFQNPPAAMISAFAGATDDDFDEWTIVEKERINSTDGTDEAMVRQKRELDFAIRSELFRDW